MCKGSFHVRVQFKRVLDLELLVGQRSRNRFVYTVIVHFVADAYPS